MKLKNILWFLLLVLIIKTLFGILNYIAPRKPQIVKETDTVLVVKYHKPDTVVKTKVKIVVRTKVDTLYTPGDSLPPVFTAKDTLITNRDTIDVSFYYPEIYFKYIVKPKPDTTRYIKEIVHYTKRDTINLKWWQRIEAGLIGFGLGILIGIIK